jgi:hypothetical protein
MTVGGSILTGQPKRAVAVAAGIIGVVRGWRAVMRGRREAAGFRSINDGQVMKRMYRRSAALAFFIGGIRRTANLKRWKIG